MATPAIPELDLSSSSTLGSDAANLAAPIVAFATGATWLRINRRRRAHVLGVIVNAFRGGQAEYSVQVTMPAWEEPYDSVDERRTLTTLYQIIYDAIHAKSGQQATLKLQYIRSEKESVMGWITQPFELYIALSPRLPKSAAVGAANAVARWVKKEESRLFLRDAPVF
ncbi:hypothetical protein MKEN_00917600 [Mycena kentingensis (nom. inval.)]|nr:hypothetical protein MKEN_00917600 [Mycena kentingensis (nom. inval.)]